MDNTNRNLLDEVDSSIHFTAWKKIEPRAKNVRTARVLLIAAAIITAMLLIPWTQNITSSGSVISLNPDSRPQSIETIIGGRVEKWFVQEGDSVKKGDTILFLSEVKVDYFDPNLVQNTESQLQSKESALEGYMSKIASLDSQINALISGKAVKKDQALAKIEQAQSKIKTDSTDLLNAQRNAIITEEQFIRYEQLFKQDLISKTELESRRMSFQNTATKVQEHLNKLAISKNELLNARRELRAIDAEYRDKISKAESEKFASMSSLYTAEGELTKLQNQFNNYDRRNGLYYILAPQSGFISKTTKSGIGETVKEGEEIARISPFQFSHSVEIFIQPVDLPLVHPGEHVRLIFDGFPAFVISGWQNISKGVYNGTILIVDPAIHESGKFRVLVTPAEGEQWPYGLRQGGGVQTIMLLNDVPVGYELWRNFNGFPPDFYSPENAKKKSEDKYK
jgi:adhesin transport system membrane fusion protein